MKRWSFPVSCRALIGLRALLAASLSGPLAPVSAAELAEELKSVPYQIVYETFRDGNWELYQANADGSQATNLTRTPDAAGDVSPRLARRHEDLLPGRRGRRRCQEPQRVRHEPGRHRPRQVAVNGRDPCWDSAGRNGRGVSERRVRAVHAPRLRQQRRLGLRPGDAARIGRTPTRRSTICTTSAVRRTASGSWPRSTPAWAAATRSWPSRPRASESSTCRSPAAGPISARTANGSPGAPSDFTLRVADLDFSGPEPKVREPARRDSQREAHGSVPRRLVARRRST